MDPEKITVYVNDRPKELFLGMCVKHAIGARGVRLVNSHRALVVDASGNRVSSNFYWLSTQPDVFDWTAADFPYARLKTYANLTALATLPPAQVSATWNSEPGDVDQVEHVQVTNTSSQLAFFVHLTALKGKGGADIAPVYWDDNYFELMPGETRLIDASYPRKMLGGSAAYIQVDGWNVVSAPAK